MNIEHGTPVAVTMRGTYDDSSIPGTAYVRIVDADDDNFLVRVDVDQIEVTTPNVQPGQMYRKDGETYVVTRTLPLSHGGAVRVTNVLTGEHVTVDHLIGAKLIADHEDLI